MGVDFVVIVGQVDVAAVRIAVTELNRFDRQRSVAIEHEAGSRRAVMDVVAPDVASF